MHSDLLFNSIFRHYLRKVLSANLFKNPDSQIASRKEGKTKMTRPKILDDPEKMRKIDRGNMLSFCVRAGEHYRQAARLAETFSVDYAKPDTIVVAGMGGSGIGGELLKDWARDRITVPIEVCKDYSLPAYVQRKTLVFVVSYSGETEETLSVFRDAIERKCMIVCISSGGKLHEFAERLSLPHLLVPSGMAPRATLPYLLIPLLTTLGKIRLVSGINDEISETISVLKQVGLENSPEKLLDDNPSKKLAKNVRGTVPAVYGFGFYRTAAHRLKTQFNENSKNPAKWETFPELDHNEIVGWEEPAELAECFSAIFIRDPEEPPEIRQRIEVTKGLMSRRMRRIYELHSLGTSRLTRMASVICRGDFASVYLAILRGIDPTPVKTITLLKKELERTGVKKKVLRELQRLASR
jgi:glucose/mannose-6-phosphate isomerase